YPRDRITVFVTPIEEFIYPAQLYIRSQSNPGEGLDERLFFVDDDTMESWNMSYYVRVGTVPGKGYPRLLDKNSVSPLASGTFDSYTDQGDGTGVAVDNSANFVESGVHSTCRLTTSITQTIVLEVMSPTSLLVQDVGFNFFGQSYD